MTTDLETAAWSGSASTPALARAEAKKRQGADADALALSAYIGSLKDVRTGLVRLAPLVKPLALLSWSIAAERASRRLARNLDTLTSEQLNVLGTWLVSTARFIPGRVERAIRVATFADRRALDDYARGRIPPHDRALAHVLVARALMLRDYEVDAPERAQIRRALNEAFGLAGAILNERDRLQSLRQLVRVLKGVGELELALGNRHRARELLVCALRLAEGEARTESQAEHLKLMLRDPRLS